MKTVTKSYVIYINTAKSQLTKVVIVINGVKHEYEEKTNHTMRSQNVLPLIEKSLRKQKLTLQDITAIEVNPGPGSFTGTRVGVTVANTLGWVLGKRVNGKQIALPKYSASKFD